MHRAPAVFVALGANLGDPVGQLRAAFEVLAQYSAGPSRTSSLWHSTPDQCPPGSPGFINAVMQLTPPAAETPESLLTRLQDWERGFGRGPKTILNEARVLDLDLIAWDAEVRHTPRLILPHPRAAQRRFVLAPLAELAPDFVLPGQSRTIAELLALAPPDPGLRRWTADIG